MPIFLSAHPWEYVTGMRSELSSEWRPCFQVRVVDSHLSIDPRPPIRKYHSHKNKGAHPQTNGGAVGAGIRTEPKPIQLEE